MMIRLVLMLLLYLLNIGTYAAEPLWNGKGRILISSDGNAHDEDDWGASALMLALLASQGMQEALPVYVYCDHIWEGRSDRKGYDGRVEMIESIEGGRDRFGFADTEFICAYDDPERAYGAVAREIDRSSSRNPLILIAAGPMQVLGEGIARANPKKLKYVTLISHGRWNDIHCSKDREKYKSDHKGWSYEEIVEAFASEEGGGLNCIHIHDQNGRDRDASGKRLFDGLNTNRDRFSWLRTSAARYLSVYKEGSWEWLYSRMEACSKNGGRDFDVSDAGMLVYVLTGSDHTSPEMVKDLMEHPKQDN